MTTLLQDLQDLVSQFESEKLTEMEVINIIINIANYYETEIANYYEEGQ